jgi:CRISPR system Cascade subunit CasE
VRRADGREADASFDAGRALHHVLNETFGPSALKPFRLMAPRERAAGTVYAYSTRSKDDLLRIANETSLPEAGAIFALDRIDERTMPASWAEGKRLAFDVRIRPTVRLRTELPNPRSGKDSYKGGAEIDAISLMVVPSSFCSVRGLTALMRCLPPQAMRSRTGLGSRPSL